MSGKSFSKKQIDIEIEAGEAWKWLRQQAFYMADYKKQEELNKKDVLSGQENELKNKYGFYPLIDPKIKTPNRLCAPIEFYIIFRNFFGQDFLDSCIYYYDINAIDLDVIENRKENKRFNQLLKRKYNYKIPDLPKRINIGIDPRKSMNSILQQVEFYLQRIRKAFKIKDERPRTTSLCLVYKAHVLNNSGVRNKEIKHAIDPLFKNDSLEKESRVKKVERIMKKARLKQTYKL